MVAEVEPELAALRPRRPLELLEGAVDLEGPMMALRCFSSLFFPFFSRGRVENKLRTF